jgi:hypothetical protein
LIGSGLAAYGVSRLQRAVLPQSFLEEQAAGEAQHPVAGAVGRIAGAVPAFPVALPKTLAEAGGRAAMQAVIGTAQTLAQERRLPTLPETLEAGATGLVLGGPNKMLLPRTARAAGVKGAQDASGIREDAGQVPKAGVVPQVSPGQGRPDLEQPTSGQPGGPAQPQTQVAPEGQPGVLLSPEHAATLEREATEKGDKITFNQPGDLPFARGQMAGIDRATRTININAPEVEAWLSRRPPEMREQMIRSLLSEERNHLATSPEDALGYWGTLTRLEQWAEKRIYGGKDWQTRYPHLADQDFAFESLRRRMDMAARMPSREFAEAMGRERVTVASLEAMGRAVRGIRETLGTKASKEGLAILDRVQGNLADAIAIRQGKQPAALSKDEPERIEEVAVRNPKTGQQASSKSKIHVQLYPEVGLDPLSMRSSEVAQASGYLTNKGRFVTQDEADQLARTAGQIHPQENLSGELVTTMPSALSKDPELNLPPRKPGEEAATAAELSRRPFNALELDRTAQAHFQSDPEKASQFKEFSKQMQSAHGPLPTGGLVDVYGRNAYENLLSASGDVLERLRRSFRLTRAFGERPIADAPVETKEPVSAEARTAQAKAQGYRNAVIRGIHDEMMNQARQSYRSFTRSAIAPEDIAFYREGEPGEGGAARKSPEGKFYTPASEPAWNVIHGEQLKSPDVLGRILTQDAREEGLPVSASKRVTVLLDEKSGKVHAVSTYRDGRRGPVLFDPGIPGLNTKLQDILKRYRPLYSVLLDEPAKDFHQTWDTLGDFENTFGKEARERQGAWREQYEPPTAEEPSAMRGPPPALQQYGPMVENDARLLFDHIEGFTDPSDPDRSSREAFADLAQQMERYRKEGSKLSAENRMYFTRLALAWQKAYDAIKAKYPELKEVDETGRNQVEDRLHQDLTAKANAHAGDAEAFTRATIGDYAPPTGEPYPVAAGRGQPVREVSPAALSKDEQQDERWRVGQRNPTAVNAVERGHTHPAVVDIATMRQNPEVFHTAAELVRRFYKYALGGAKNLTDDQVIQKFRKHMADNLVWLWNKYGEKYKGELVRRARQWYDGARRISEEWSQRFKQPRHVVAAVLATQSPKKEWFQNLALGERLLEIVTGPAKNRWTPEMTEVVKGWLKSKTFAPDTYRDVEKNWSIVRRTPWNKLTDWQKALFVRAYSEAHHSFDYHQWSPEGERLDLARNKPKREGEAGEPTALVWQTFKTIAKGISVIENPTLENISRQLGENHKVRSFYNNILNPNNYRFGDVTIDTHHVAAALLKPLGQKAVEVKHSMGGTTKIGELDPRRPLMPAAEFGPGSDDVRGFNGLYAIHADAARDAAGRISEQTGERVLPRELQSVTWEAGRGLFSPEFKRNEKALADIDKLWDDVARGKRTAKQVRELIYERANGIKDPSWHGRGSGSSPVARTARDVGQLPGVQFPGSAGRPAGLGRGRRAGDTGTPPQRIPEAGRGPAALNKEAERIQGKAADLTAQVKAAVHRAPDQQRMVALYDGAENVANSAGRNAENAVLSTSKNPAVRRASVAMRSAGGVYEDLTRLGQQTEGAGQAGGAPAREYNVTSLEHALPNLERMFNDAAEGLAKAQWLRRNGDLRQRLNIAPKWEKEAKEMIADIRYASEHWNDPELQEQAKSIARELDRTRDYEIENGSTVRLEPNHVPGRYDAEFFNNDSVMFGERRVLGKNYRKPATFKDYWEAIKHGPGPDNTTASGPYLPKNLDAPSLVGSRVRQGWMDVEKNKWVNMGKDLNDPHTGLPVVGEMRVVDGKEVMPPNYVPVQQGYKTIPVLKGYDSVYRQMLEASWFRDMPLFHGALRMEAFLKHGLLFGDFFHLGRVLYYGSSILGRRLGYRGGLSALEWRPEDLQKGVASGALRQKDVDWVNQRIPGTDISRHEALQIAQREGANVQRITDALYRDVVDKWPVIGQYNKFLFEKLTRGLMANSIVHEIERLRTSDPSGDIRDQIRQVSRDVNLYFGNPGRQAWWSRSATARDIANLTFLAPGWVTGLLGKEIGAIGQLGGWAAALGQKPMGTIGRGIGRGLLFSLILAQTANMISRRKPTWENEDDNGQHKLDAWIPGFDGGPGHWFSPLSVFAELTHQAVKLTQTKPKAWDVVQQIGENKLSPIGRLAVLAATDKKPTGEYITSTPGMVKEAARELAPFPPISLGVPFRGIAHLIAPNLVGPLKPGEAQQRVASTLGVKLEAGSTVMQQAQGMARKFIADHGLQKDTGWMQVQTDDPSYSKLRTALRNGDTAGARKLYDAMRASHGGGLKGDDAIVRAMHMWENRPFTGSRDYELAMLRGMNDQQLQVYTDAVRQKAAEFNNFVKFYLDNYAP